jgi:hypothetical protein
LYLYNKITLKIKSKASNEQEPNGSMRMPSKEFEEKLRQARVRRMKESYEKRMKEYRER